VRVLGDVMKKRLLASVALCALGAVTPAMAADQPVKAPVYTAPVAAVYNWTGCYAGGNIGYSWGRARGDFNASGLGVLGLPTSNSISLNPNGLIGGAQFGCNWQVDNKWVLGLEADFQGSAERHSSSDSDPFDFEGVNAAIVTGTVNQNIESKILWFGTLRGRAGVLVTPTILVYGTGGLAYGKASVFDTITVTRSLLSSATTSIGDSKTKFGWTLGAGVEGAFPNSTDWTWKVEYLYVDLGSFSGAGTDPVVGSFSWNTRVTDNIVRVGFNYRFH
jgi:outer membrane immunogenic protein